MPSSYLTHEGFERLQTELEYLRTEKRKEVAVRLREALEDGELIENAELEAAKSKAADVVAEKAFSLMTDGQNLIRKLLFDDCRKQLFPI